MMRNDAFGSLLGGFGADLRCWRGYCQSGRARRCPRKDQGSCARSERPQLNALSNDISIRWLHNSVPPTETPSLLPSPLYRTIGG